MLLGSVVGIGLALAGITSNEEPWPADAAAMIDDQAVPLALYRHQIQALAKDKRTAISDDDRAHVLERLIEEELLLALPMVAYHEHACVDASLYSSGESVEDEQEQQAPNPFKVLEQLKGSPK